MQTATRNDSPATVLCEVRDVAHDFRLPDHKATRVIEGINLRILPGEIVCLLGPSGCGKSTILRILAGLIAPTHGEVLYHGEPLHGLNPGVAMVFQSFALYPWMTVLENVQIVLRVAGLERSEVQTRSSAIIRTVGLAGSEGAYPRELSGGMKQRVGIARALALNPEVLFMDEPFSQVDALTAESLRAEVTDIWAVPGRHPESVVMVSHDIREVVYMADRIVVLGANPGRVLAIVENPLPRPRSYAAPEAIALVDRLHNIITGHELPDAAAAPGAEPGQDAPIEPLPGASTSEIVGLLEFLDSRGGRQDIFHIASETNSEFGRLLAVVEAGEMLNLVDTPRRDVVLDTEGIRFVKADAIQRQTIWREQLLKLRLFRDVQGRLAARPDRSLPGDDVLRLIGEALPYEDSHKVFETLVRWARYGNLFAYDKHHRILSLH
ncbi:MAG: ABC transporter ATP-binding protein [Candidatus Krumholzibacteriia bacterium]